MEHAKGLDAQDHHVRGAELHVLVVVAHDPVEVTGVPGSEPLVSEASACVTSIPGSLPNGSGFTVDAVPRGR